MTEHTINTISEFMLHAGTQYRVYDMGRGIELIDSQKFNDIESNLIPVPRPRAGFAWFGIVFWNAQLSHEQYIWFVKLPIDERSLIVQAARNQFLETVITALGSELEKSAEKGGQLPENPFIFVPSQQQLADINAMIRRDLILPARLGLDKAIAYLKNPKTTNWQDLALQDISDLAAHIKRKDIAHAVNKNLAQLPVQVLTALCSSFENNVYGQELTSSLIQLYQSAAHAEIQHMVLRGLKGSDCEDQVRGFLFDLLQAGQPDVECLVVIAGRHFSLLNDERLLVVYLTKLIELDASYQLFKGVYTDLVQVPETRIGLLTLMHKSDLPKPIARGFASLYQQVSPSMSAS
ncbi:MAG: hypothetical protein ACI97K_001692 [Glaciecola sp.]|jgi:hypothetical protein